MASTEHDPRDVEAAKAAYEKNPIWIAPFDALIEQNTAKLVNIAKVSRLMAEGKWPEVDPDLIVARECAAEAWKGHDQEHMSRWFQNGDYDDTPAMRAIRLAIKRTRAPLDGGR